MSFASVQAELPYRNIGGTIAFIIVIGVVVYVFINVLLSGKKEIGSEIEVAANRKPYLGDDELEGRRLDRVLTYALWTLFVIAVALPLYWIMEPGRQSNAAVDFNDKFVAQGEKLFAVTG